MRSFLATVFGLSLLAAPALAQSAAPAQPAPPSDAQILESQVGYYGLLVQRLNHDLAQARAALPAAIAERDKAWSDYSKPLWEPQKATESVK